MKTREQKAGKEKRKQVQNGGYENRYETWTGKFKTDERLEAWIDFTTLWKE